MGGGCVFGGGGGGGGVGGDISKQHGHQVHFATPMLLDRVASAKNVNLRKQNTKNVGSRSQKNMRAHCRFDSTNRLMSN